MNQPHNAIAVRSENGALAPTFTNDQLELIKRTVAKGTTDDELALFLYTAATRGLDPLLKQVHAIKRWSNKEKRDVMSIQVGIDGYRLIAERTRLYVGNDDAEYGPKNEQGYPEWARITVWKLVGRERFPFTASARWVEYCPDDAQAFMWKKMPFLMLAKCAEALALRKAFPAELGGMYIHEEMDQAASGAARVIDTGTGEVRDAPSSRRQTSKAEAETVAMRERYARALEAARDLGIEVVELPAEGGTLGQARKWCETTEKLIAEHARDQSANATDEEIAATRAEVLQRSREREQPQVIDAQAREVPPDEAEELLALWSEYHAARATAAKVGVKLGPILAGEPNAEQLQAAMRDLGKLIARAQAQAGLV